MVSAHAYPTFKLSNAVPQKLPLESESWALSPYTPSAHLTDKFNHNR